jgi:hypothetical protein
MYFAAEVKILHSHLQEKFSSFCCILLQNLKRSPAIYKINYNLSDVQYFAVEFKKIPSQLQDKF